jgi:hypothetical protein
MVSMYGISATPLFVLQGLATAFRPDDHAEYWLPSIPHRPTHREVDPGDGLLLGVDLARPGRAQSDRKRDEQGERRVPQGLRLSSLHEPSSKTDTEATRKHDVNGCVIWSNCLCSKSSTDVRE